MTFMWQSVCLKLHSWASLVAQWLGIHLPMQGTWFRVPVREDPTCRGAARPVSYNYWACASGACAPQRERSRQWEAHAPRWRVAPARHNWRKPLHRNEDPTQPKINKLINLKKNYILGPSWWCSGYKSTCQCTRHGFEPRSGNIPPAAEQLSPCATTTEPTCHNFWSPRA